MNLLTLLLICGIILLIAYFTYGRFLEKQLKVDGDRKTPAHEMYDGIDYVPAKNLFCLDTISLQLLEVARLSDRSRQQYLDGFRLFYGL